MVFDTTQIITLTLFLGLLCVALFVVKRYQPQLRAHLATGKRILVHETTHLGGQDRALLISVDQSEYLVVIGKRSGASVTALPVSTQEIAQ